MKTKNTRPQLQTGAVAVYCWGAYCWGAICWGAYCWGAYCWGAYCWGAICWAGGGACTPYLVIVKCRKLKRAEELQNYTNKKRVKNGGKKTYDTAAISWP